MTEQTDRAKAIQMRTYARPKADGTLESWKDIVDRVIGHQKWLWERSTGGLLKPNQENELKELRQFILDFKVCPAGRTLWLGGTDISRTRESCQFNCSFTEVETVRDVVDVMWLLLQGCGVGFKPRPGVLTGYIRPLESVTVIKSARKNKGRETNVEKFNAKSGVWEISVGDSAEAWAKAVGKLVAGEFPAKHLVLNFSQIRPAGERLKGYGWISSGDAQIRVAFEKIARLMSNRSDQILTKLDILDIVNLLGTTLSSRRSAEIALCDYGSEEWREFAFAKKNWWESNPHRQMSNNSLVFDKYPGKESLQEVFDIVNEAGGSEPGIINAEEARRRAPWFRGVNPCCEILLGNKSFCNLTEVNLNAFVNDRPGLERALTLVARMNYRQTCVNLKDGILQDTWHKNNNYLRLCGVGLTGIACREDLTAYDYKVLRNVAVSAAYSMANELGLSVPKNITTVKPSGTLSKIMGTKERGEVPEGIHKPLGRYIFNNVTFSKYDPLVERFKDANYSVIEKPFEPESVLIKFPVEFSSVKFDVSGSKEVNIESAIKQLDRYKKIMDNWCDQNASITVNYSPEEVPEIIEWLDKNWTSYVGVSFIYRTDPTKTAKDLGYEYLPQEVTTEEEFKHYVDTLKEVCYNNLNNTEEDFDTDQAECAGGHCPVK